MIKITLGFSPPGKIRRHRPWLVATPCTVLQTLAIPVSIIFEKLTCAFFPHYISILQPIQILKDDVHSCAHAQTLFTF